MTASFGSTGRWALGVTWPNSGKMLTSLEAMGAKKSSEKGRNTPLNDIVASSTNGMKSVREFQFEVWDTKYDVHYAICIA